MSEASHATATAVHSSRFEKWIPASWIRSDTELREKIAETHFAPWHAFEKWTHNNSTGVPSLFALLMLILCLSRRFSNLSYGALLRAFGIVTLGLGVADLISSSLKEFWGRPKPFVVHVGSGDFPLSFPSNHATNISFFCVLMAGAWVAKWPRTYRYVGWLVLGTLAIAVSVSRVTFGQHYPLDVVAGCGLGAALAGLSLVGLRWSGWLQPNRR